jgi:hypothetical protein
MTATEKLRTKPKLATVPPAPSKPLAPDSCATCRFYMLIDGVCRRYPPQPLVTKTGRESSSTVAQEWRGVFPPMLPGGWCGEWKAA